MPESRAPPSFNLYNASIPALWMDSFPATRALKGILTILNEKSQTVFATPNPPSASSPLIGLLQYAVLSYAFCSMAMAMVINRTTIFASTRPHRKLPKLSGYFLRAVAIAPLVYLLWKVGFTFYEHEPVSPAAWLPHGWGGWWLPGPPGDSQRALGTAHACLWPGFLAVCWSQYVEVFVAVANNDPKGHSDNGLTLFELSMILLDAGRQPNLKPEVLAVLAMALATQLSIQLMGLSDWLLRYRLIPLGAIGCTFLAYFGYKITTGTILDFPTIIVWAFIPHLIILMLLVVCVAIALMACGFSGARIADLSVWEVYNEEDPRAVRMGDDFYTFLDNVSIVAMVSAAKIHHASRAQTVYGHRCTFVDNVLGYRNAVEFPVEAVVSLAPEQKESGGPVRLLRRRMRWVRSVGMFGQLVRSLWRRQPPLFLERPEDGCAHGGHPTKESSSSDMGEVDYVRLLLGAALPEVDLSRDFSDAEDPSETTDDEANHAAETTDDEGEDPGERPTEVLSLLTSLVLEVSYLQSHLSRESSVPLTRSRYRRMQQGPSEAQSLVEVILEKRMPQPDVADLSCVVCQTNVRDIIFWPCKCFAICDGCRVSLTMRDFDKCVCCRRDVRGYSRVFVP